MPKFIAFLAAYGLLIVVTTILFFGGLKDWARFVADAGSMIVALTALSYVAFFDSRRRWPHASLGERLYKLFTFRY